MASWFFFSYARDDQNDSLDKFYADLCQKIRLATRLNADEVGFLDQSDIKLGDKWNEKLAEALRTCKVMVSICSPNYFARPYCGKEFQVCFDRQASLAKTSTAMFSVIWGMPDASVHRTMKRFQYTHRSLPPIYRKEGLQYMMDLTRHSDDYKEFVTRLAQAIVRAGTQHPLPELKNLKSMDQVRNAFARNGKQVTALQRNAIFTYVAGEPHEIRSLPRNLLRDREERYGKGGRDWRPFYPDYLDTVGNVAMLATANQKMYYKELPLDTNLIDSIREAEKERQIVILLVDPCSIRVKTYRESMQELEKYNFENSAVLVVWNSLIRTKAQRDKFQKDLEGVFKFRARFQRSVYYIDSIASDRELRITLSETLCKLQNSLIENSDLQNGIQHPDLSRRAQQRGIKLGHQPVVSGPGDRRK
jgi:FxsC-like protein